MNDMAETRIYLDLDGVLADFSRGVRELCGMEAAPQNGERDYRQDERMWEAIRKADHFYGRLEPVPGSGKLFREIRKAYGDRCEILTGIPKPRRGIATAGEDKIQWVRRFFSSDIRVRIVQREEKIRFCTGPESILVDDREDTIRDWREKGGTGILFTGAEEALRALGLGGASEES